MISKILSPVLFLLITICLFLTSDFYISKHTDLFHVKKDCFKYLKHKHNNKDYYSYELEKNCFAFETKGRTGAYEVITNKNGHRIGKKKSESKKEKDKILFLGDSFTYGFGVNYKDSISGLINSKSNNQFDIINFGVPGYSQSMTLHKLKKYLNDSKNLKIKKVFYVLDLTDVHDESNRWINVEGLNHPVILDQSIEKEIKDNFEIKKKFRTSRFLSYVSNKILRNIRKDIKNLFLKREEITSNGPGTFWGRFTHTPQKELYTDEQYKDLWPIKYNVGIKNIKLKLKEISEIISPYNAEFYILIHPWRETLELGQSEFSWENFANEVCVFTECTKVISLFDDIRDIKKINPYWKSEIYFNTDVHFNKKGNIIYANRIYLEAFN